MLFACLKLWFFFSLPFHYSACLPRNSLGPRMPWFTATWDPQCYALLEGLEDTLVWEQAKWEHIAQKWPRIVAPCTGSNVGFGCQSFFCTVGKLMQHSCQKWNIGALESLQFIGQALFLQRCVNQGSSEANRSCASSFLYESTLELVVSASRPAERLIFSR